jgi:hypothetical protein
VLSGDQDSYMISPCAADKWLVVELSQEARPFIVWRFSGLI